MASRNWNTKLNFFLSEKSIYRPAKDVLKVEMGIKRKFLNNGGRETKPQKYCRLQKGVYKTLFKKSVYVFLLFFIKAFFVRTQKWPMVIYLTAEM